MAAEFVRVELTENQVGLRTENGVLAEVLAPATRRLYWKGLVDVQVEVIDITDGPVLAPFDPDRSQRFVLWTRKPLR